MLTDAVPLYPLYALAFADAGLDEGRISALLALWSVVAVVAEVPCGALADRFSRRLALVGAGLLTAAGFAVWTLRPTFAGFAAGFVLWGVGGALASGAYSALLYDGLRAADEEARFAGVLGRAEAGALLVQVPLAAVAGALVAVGGFALVGAVSVVVCLAAAGLAATLPDVCPPACARSGCGRPCGRPWRRRASSPAWTPWRSTARCWPAGGGFRRAWCPPRRSPSR